MKKILIVSPAWLGDCIMAQALFKFIKAQFPQTSIDILASTGNLELFRMMPELNELIAFSIPHGELKLSKRWQIGRKLKDKKYSQAIVLPNSWKSAILPFAAKIPLRAGWLGEMRIGLLNNFKKVDKNKLQLMVERFLALGVSPITHNKIPWQPYQPKLIIEPLKQQLVLKKLINKLDLHLDLQSASKHGLLILCPGAAYGPAKRWPAEHFAELAQNKLKEGWKVCILGDKTDQAIAQTIQNLTQNQCINLVGQTTLTEAIYILNLATVVVTNDSGLMHVAAALNRPLIALYGSSSPNFTPPLTQNCRILSLELECRPCFKRQCPLHHFRCLRKLMPTQVMDAMNDLLQ